MTRSNLVERIKRLEAERDKTKGTMVLSGTWPEASMRGKVVPKTYISDLLKRIDGTSRGLPKDRNLRQNEFVKSATKIFPCSDTT